MNFLKHRPSRPRTTLDAARTSLILTSIVCDSVPVPGIAQLITLARKIVETAQLAMQGNEGVSQLAIDVKDLVEAVTGAPLQGMDDDLVRLNKLFEEIRDFVAEEARRRSSRRIFTTHIDKQRINGYRGRIQQEVNLLSVRYSLSQRRNEEDLAQIKATQEAVLELLLAATRSSVLSTRIAEDRTSRLPSIGEPLCGTPRARVRSSSCLSEAVDVIRRLDPHVIPVGDVLSEGLEVPEMQPLEKDQSAEIQTLRTQFGASNARDQKQSFGCSTHASYFITDVIPSSQNDFLNNAGQDCIVAVKSAFSSFSIDADFKSPPKELAAIDDSKISFKGPAVWPIILWIAFQVQTVGSSPESKNIKAFFAIIESNARKHWGLWHWDEIDEQVLRQNLVPQTHTRSSWIDYYPASWQEYINLLDYEDWGRIETLTHQSSRYRLTPLEYDTAIRIGAVLLWTSSNSFADPAHLGILLNLETFFPGDRVLGFWRCLLDRRLGELTQSDLGIRGEAVDWHRPGILLDSNKAQLPYALPDSNTMPFIYMVENMYIIYYLGRALPLNFMSSVLAWLSRKFEDHKRLDELRAWISIWKTWDTTTCLINFRSVLSITFTFSKLIEEQDLPRSLINEMMQADLRCVCTQVAGILTDPIARQDFLKARNDEAQQLLDLLQDLLDYPCLHNRLRPMILEALRKLSLASGRIPGCFVLSDRLQLDGPHQVAAGGFGDVWKGLVQGETVCVKVMRVYQEADVEALLKEFYHEALIWRQLSHPNLLPFFGLYHLEDTKSRLCLVSPWMENGNIPRYLKNNSVGINRLTLVLDTGLGLEHLHSLKLVHGDLKAMNVLITRSGRAVLADFGLSSVADSRVLLSTSSGKRGGTVRWQAPELFRGGRNSFASDVYAFSCVCYEIFTGDLPFCDLTKDGAVILEVMQGHRPRRSLSIPDDVWDLMEECWKADPEERPSAKQIVFRLRDCPICATPTDAASDWDSCYTSKFRSSLEEHTLFLSTATI